MTDLVNNLLGDFSNPVLEPLGTIVTLIASAYLTSIMVRLLCVWDHIMWGVWVCGSTVSGCVG
jgi:hypothetical protein